MHFKLDYSIGISGDAKIFEILSFQLFNPHYAIEMHLHNLTNENQILTLNPDCILMHNLGLKITNCSFVEAESRKENTECNFFVAKTGLRMEPFLHSLDNHEAIYFALRTLLHPYCQKL